MAMVPSDVFKGAEHVISKLLVETSRLKAKGVEFDEIAAPYRCNPFSFLEEPAPVASAPQTFIHHEDLDLHPVPADLSHKASPDFTRCITERQCDLLISPLQIFGEVLEVEGIELF